jgi:hypothetical protein
MITGNWWALTGRVLGRVAFHPWLWIAFGSVTLISLLLLGGLAIYTRLSGTITTGVVTRSFGVRFSTFYDVEFTIEAGQRVTISVGRFGPRYERGSTVSVVYRAENPAGAFLVRPLLPDDLPIVVSTPIVGLIGWLSFRFGWRRRGGRARARGSGYP